MTATAFSNMLSLFNREVEKHGRQVSAPRLRRNGLYCAILFSKEAGAAVGDAGRLHIPHAHDPAAVSEFRKHYTAWKQLFYPGHF